MFKVGEVVGVVRLKKAYDQYALMVLGGYVQQQPSERKETASGKSRRVAASYKIKQTMPTAAEYTELKRKRFTSTAGELMDEAYSEIESLGEEMRGWYDNLTDTLQQNDRGQRVDEAANTLEGISAQESTDLMSQVDVYHLPSLDTSSRSKRASEASSILQDVAAACHDYVSENRPEASDEEESAEKKEADTTYEDSDYDELDSIADQCEDDAGEVDGVEFPGMYD